MLQLRPFQAHIPHKNLMPANTSYTPIPTRRVGPIHITGNTVNDTLDVPLATYETPLWPSVGRGAKLSRLSGGICVTVMDARMTRSVVFALDSAAAAFTALQTIAAEGETLAAVVAGTSRYCRLLDIHPEIVGNLLYLRFAFATGDASGHNMATKAAEALIAHLLAHHPELHYGSISGNACTDKKTSAVNAILGRGKKCVAEIVIPEAICAKHLRTTAAKMVELNTRKNHIGSNIAGSLRSANAHYANMLLAFYLATGQDAANIIEGSQGITHCENRNGDLYFSCTLPNLIVGTVGNGKGQGLETVEEHLQALGCRAERESGENARRLAAICAATVLCGELSLMAAQTNPGELMRTHILMERRSA